MLLLCAGTDASFFFPDSMTEGYHSSYQISSSLVANVFGIICPSFNSCLDKFANYLKTPINDTIL